MVFKTDDNLILYFFLFLYNSRCHLQLHLAQEGISLGTSANGAAAECIKLLGGGLSNDQLRWIYSSFDTAELIANGWDPSSVPFLDDNDNTHMWSELNENCTSNEIVLSAEASSNGTSWDAFDFFTQHVLSSRGETSRDYFSSEDADEVDSFVHANGNAITVTHLFDMISADFQDRHLLAIGVADDEGNVVMPSAKMFEDEKYPLLKKVNFAMVNRPEALALTRPFLEFGLSDEGTDILKQSGYWPIRDWEKLTMYTRLQSERGLDVEGIKTSCGPENGHISIGGSDTVLPVAHVWSEIYKLGCPYDIEINGGGSSVGAGRICGNPEMGTAVDVGMMSRDFALDETVETETEFLHSCLKGDDTRSVIQIDVALDGITVMFPIGGEGELCVIMLDGLTMDQLRWIYSSYTDEKLEQTGWDPRSLKSSDHDSRTHLWSELDSRCAEEEIQLAGDYWNDGSFTSFSEQILPDIANGEMIADTRPKPYVEAYGFDVLKYMLEHHDAISYVGYHYYFEHRDVFWAAPIESSSGSNLFVTPSEDTIKDRSYPLVRSIFMNLLNDEDALRDAVPLLKFGFSRPDLISSSGYVPILGNHRSQMLKRMNDAPYDVLGIEDDVGGSSSVGMIVGVVAAALVLVILVVVGVTIIKRRWNEQ
jgi:ABC-type phosphate transport system substrate-binding protein